MENKLLLTFYLASAIENNGGLKGSSPESWKKEIKDAFPNPLVGIYDPIEREAQKTGKTSTETCEQIKNLKKGGAWEAFHLVMSKIWWGMINTTNQSRIQIMMALRIKFAIDGNERRDLDFFGDYEAVLRSNFIVAYLEKNVRTVGTICEIHTCYLFGIPVYLIIPDQTKTDANSTLIDMTIKSGGQIFYSVGECIKFIKNNYNVGEK